MEKVVTYEIQESGRSIIYKDVCSLPKDEAEKYLRDTIMLYRNKSSLNNPTNK